MRSRMTMILALGLGALSSLGAISSLGACSSSAPGLADLQPDPGTSPVMETVDAPQGSLAPQPAGADAGSVDALPPSVPALPDPPAVLCPDRPLNPGTHPADEGSLEIEVDGRTRRYKLHVPSGHDGSTAIPLIFVLHGYTQNGGSFGVNSTGMVEKADAEGFAAVFPDGDGGSWNAGYCCPPANPDVDDVAFMKALIDQVSQEVCIDPERIYATGLSNGGFMSYALACFAADTFAAIAPVAGTTLVHPEDCTPSRAVPVLHIHGTEDGFVGYEGGGIATGPLALLGEEAPTVPDNMQAWAERNGCSPNPVPAARPRSEGALQCETYLDCSDEAEVTLCLVEGGGHCWFGDPSCGTGAGEVATTVVGSNAPAVNTADLVWDFVSRFSLSGRR